MGPTPKQLEEYADETSGIAAAFWSTAEGLHDDGEADTAEMYEGDADDAERIEKLLRAGKFPEAWSEVQSLDTSARDHYEWARSAEVLPYARKLQGNPGGGWLRGLAMAGLAALGVGGFVLGYRESQGK